MSSDAPGSTTGGKAARGGADGRRADSTSDATPSDGDEHGARASSGPPPDDPPPDDPEVGRIGERPPGNTGVIGRDDLDETDHVGADNPHGAAPPTSAVSRGPSLQPGDTTVDGSVLDDRTVDDTVLDDNGLDDTRLDDTARHDAVTTMEPAGVSPTLEQPPASPPIPTGKEAAAGGRAVRRGLRVTQRLWSVDPWSVFKISVLFYLCTVLMVLVAGAVLWNVARSAGAIDSAEGFVTRLGAYGSCVEEGEVAEGVSFETDDDCRDGEVLVGGFEIDDGALWRAAAIGGGVLVIAGSIGNVLMTVLLNLLNEVTGGLRHTVVTEPAGRGRGGSTRGARRR